jgi:hypothetical protein
MDVFMAPVMALDVSSFSAARRGGQFQQGHGNNGGDRYRALELICQGRLRRVSFICLGIEEVDARRKLQQ